MGLTTTEILNLAGTICKSDDLWISGEEGQFVRRSRHNREAIAERNRGSCLQARDLKHPRCPWKVQRKRGPQVA